MARMLGRFLRSYPGYTAEKALDMPFSRFWALYQAIPELEASDDLRALMVAGYGANPGKDGQGFAKMVKALQAQAEGQSADQALRRPVVPGVTPGTVEATPGSLRAERLAKLAALREAAHG